MASIAALIARTLTAVAAEATPTDQE